MDRIRLPRCLRGTALALAAAALGFASGCTGTKWGADESSTRMSNSTASPFQSLVKTNASATATPGAAPNSSAAAAAATASLPLDPPKRDKTSKGPATTMAAAWRNHIDYLADPANHDKPGPGIAGQIFLYDRATLPVEEADGKLIVDLFDETPRPPGYQGLIPERFEFTKDVLKTLHSSDERFGKCFVIFLPWPAYRPDVTQVRIEAKFVPDPHSSNQSVIAPSSKFALDNSPFKSESNFTGPPDNSMPGLQGIMQAGGWSGPTGSYTPPNNIGWGSYGNGNGSQMGMGSLTPGSPYASPASGAPPMGVLGGRPSGAPAGYAPAGSTSSPPLPISGAPMTGVPAASLMGGSGNLTPLGNAPQGLPPLAYSTSPLGK